LNTHGYNGVVGKLYALKLTHLYIDILSLFIKMVQMNVYLDDKRNQLISELAKELKTNKHEAILYCIDQLIDGVEPEEEPQGPHDLTKPQSADISNKGFDLE
jgi:hypothetical protein